MAIDPAPTPAEILPAELIDRVIGGLGLVASPTPDLEGLADLYGAWCRRVPFDNVRKLIALADAAELAPGAVAPPLPGIDAVDFFEAWLGDGTGGTCWPGANALHHLLAALGFDSRRVAASMGDSGQPSHGTTVVTLDGAQWLVDTSMLTGVPVFLPSDGSATTGTGRFETTVDAVDEGWLFHFQRSSGLSTLPCRTISAGAVTWAFFAERYEVSRTWSPFNDGVCVRVNLGDLLVSWEPTRGDDPAHRCERSDTRFERLPIDDEALRAALVDEVGLTNDVVDRVLSRTSPTATG